MMASPASMRRRSSPTRTLPSRCAMRRTACMPRRTRRRRYGQSWNQNRTTSIKGPIMSAIVGLNKGYTAIVDDEDYERVSAIRWFVNKTGYADHAYRKDGRIQRLLMHRLVLDAPDGMQVDHIDGGRLDNRKCNLRFCTTAQNSINRKLIKKWGRY